jgi:D-lactate dehydrogenase (cytochrome)
MIQIRDDSEFLKEYLRDESRLMGKADSISFPENQAEIQEILKKHRAASVPVTVQGSRTGITGGAVPLQGHILNLSRMNKVLGLRRDQHNDVFYLTVQPGLKLQELVLILQTGQFNTTDWDGESLAALANLVQQGPYFFPPDPTESTASLGGMVACNASGARSFYYGPTRKYIEAIQVILADGSQLVLQRGKQRSHNGHLCSQPLQAKITPSQTTSPHIRGLQVKTRPVIFPAGT